MVSRDIAFLNVNLPVFTNYTVCGGGITDSIILDFGSICLNVILNCIVNFRVFIMINNLKETLTNNISLCAHLVSNDVDKRKEDPIQRLCILNFAHYKKV